VLQVAVPSLSIQVEIVESKNPNSSLFWLSCAVPSLSQLQVELLKVKVSQQFTLLVLQVVADHHYPKYRLLLKVKVSQQFALSVLQVVRFPSLSSTGLVFESRKVSPWVLLSCKFNRFHIIHMQWLL
jgi:hypothetical protein